MNEWYSDQHTSNGMMVSMMSASNNNMISSNVSSMMIGNNNGHGNVQWNEQWHDK